MDERTKERIFEPFFTMKEMGWMILVQSHDTVWNTLAQLGFAIGSPNLFMIFIWVGSVVAAVRFVLENVNQKRENKSNDGEDALLFAYVALPMSAAAYFLWLWVTRY